MYANVQGASRKKRSKKLIVGVVAGAAAVVACAVAVWFAFFAPYPITFENFPDQAIRNVIINEVDLDHNGEVSRDEANAVRSLSVDGATTLDGIGRFPHLQEIYVNGGSLSSADISALGELETFEAAESILPSLDVSHNPNLTTLVVPETTAVTGLENTPLVETWLPVNRSASYEYTSSSSLEKAWDEKLYRDPKGRPLSDVKTYYDMYGSITSETTYTFSYNDAEQMSGMTISSYYPSGSGSSDPIGFTFTYDDAGRLVKSTSDVSGYTTHFIYNDEGELSGVAYSNSPDGEYFTEDVITYQNGQPQAAMNEYYVNMYWVFNGDRLENCLTNYGEATMKSHQLTYDESGRIVASSGTNLVYYDDEMAREYGGTDDPRIVRQDSSVAIADGSGNVIDASALPADYTVSYTYDDLGRIVSAEGSSQTESGASSSSQQVSGTCEYDERGFLSAVDVQTSTESHYSGKTENYSDRAYYEQETGRYFVLRDGKQPPEYFILAPSYDTTLFTQYTLTLDLPLDSNIPIAFNYVTVNGGAIY